MRPKYKELYQQTEERIKELEEQLTAEISDHTATKGKLHRLRKHINDLSPFRKLLAGVNPAHPDLKD